MRHLCYGFCPNVKSEMQFLRLTLSELISNLLRCRNTSHNSGEFCHWRGSKISTWQQGPTLQGGKAGSSIWSCRHGGVQWQAFLLQAGAPKGSPGSQRGAVPHPEDDRASGKDWLCLHTLLCLQGIVWIEAVLAEKLIYTTEDWWQSFFAK